MQGLQVLIFQRIWRRKNSWMKVQAGNAGSTSKLLRQDIWRIPTESSDTMLFSNRFLTNREAYQYDVSLEFKKYERHYTWTHSNCMPVFALFWGCHTCSDNMTKIDLRFIWKIWLFCLIWSDLETPKLIVSLSPADPTLLLFSPQTNYPKSNWEIPFKSRVVWIIAFFAEKIWNRKKGNGHTINSKTLDGIQTNLIWIRSIVVWNGYTGILQVQCS